MINIITEGFLILNKEVRIELPNNNSTIEAYNTTIPNSVFSKAVVVTVPYKQGLYDKLYSLIGIDDVEMQVGVYRRNKEEVTACKYHIQITNITLNKLSISFTFHFTSFH